MAHAGRAPQSLDLRAIVATAHAHHVHARAALWTTRGRALGAIPSGASHRRVRARLSRWSYQPRARLDHSRQLCETDSNARVVHDQPAFVVTQHGLEPTF
jgi:hypothetical protein